MSRALFYTFLLALSIGVAHAQENAEAFPDAVITEPLNDVQGIVTDTVPAPVEPPAQTMQPVIDDDGMSGGSQGAYTIETAPQGSPTEVMDEPIEPKPPEYEDQPQVELRILDKVRAESRTYILNVGRTVAYANIRIRPRACRRSSPLDAPEDAAFLQIWEVKPDGVSAWIFSGWMFASSPSLSAMDHPVYDVSVLDCKDPVKDAQSEAKTSESSEITAPETQASGEEVAPETPAEEPAADAESTNETPVEDNAASSSE